MLIDLCSTGNKTGLRSISKPMEHFPCFFPQVKKGSLNAILSVNTNFVKLLLTLCTR